MAMIIIMTIILLLLIFTTFISITTVQQLLIKGKDYGSQALIWLVEVKVALI